MSLPSVAAVTPGSPAARAGVMPGDEIRSMGGQVLRDVISYQILADEAVVDLELARGGLELAVTVYKEAAEPLGLEISSALFDRIRTCDNHCEFCFIHQLPKGMRPSLYVKDDDYRLSFLYGNFTTLTRFTESDLERVVTERLSPLYVSIHATDPDVRARMLRNRRGATSLRWLRVLLDHGIVVHGQVVVCPGVNDGAVLDDTLTGVLDRFADLATVACVPLGVSKHSGETGLRGHTTAEAAAVVEQVDTWQGVFGSVLGRRMVWAADEYYLLADRPFPPADSYEGYSQHENGIGMARAFADGFQPAASGGGMGTAQPQPPRHSGFFQAVDGAPAEGYRAVRSPGTVTMRPSRRAPVAVVTGEYGAQVLRPLLPPTVRVVTVVNHFFGGTTRVAGLLTGTDVARALATEPEGHRYLLPDVCLNEGRFLDGLTLADLPRPVEVVPADGSSLRLALAPRPELVPA